MEKGQAYTLIDDFRVARISAPYPMPTKLEWIFLPRTWPRDTKIMVPATINWINQISENEWEGGITYQGNYPYNSDCSSIWLFKKENEKLVPIKPLI